MPRMRFIAAQLNYLIKTFLKRPNVKFSWETDAAMDPLARAQASQIYLANKVVTADEVRADDLGKAPLSAAQKDELTPPAPPPAVPGPLILKPGETAHEAATGKPLFGNPAAKQEDKPPVIKVEPNIYMGDNFIRVHGDALEKRVTS